ncbi:MAG: PAS domain S-box protein [Candidatus Jettenia sp.]|uniref:histidine kinase n=1 Tax=Candidatus Jettenia caeni TaxID=247490 RepID=I3IMD9_9BACT|nr:GAF domain-containing sensor histidine kinase [Candidatus Jettenia sp. AMX1]MBC6927764.1 PAS domain S-box protein [Candidatus Jettenia sp.]GAB62884.1 two-component sensor kinase [Candidatus Jettenia caeni]KAA0251447.1 MAG: GAF domain-containing sensor histidine kinase [Candidatus Jettenia sp. AMX1]MCE7879430.1 PAS domain S-box protein [Candidatus Jettenia sp. AMX1]MDL1938379.1 GAF domain-containing sensor histidine kinase [Candidatus Jettenia sp. AMX1]
MAKQKQLKEKIKSITTFSEKNPHPLLCVTGDGTVVYANPSGKALLQDWHCDIGQFVPDYLRQLVMSTFQTRVIQRNIETKYGNQIFSFTIVPATNISYVNLYGVDITEHKRAEESLKYRIHFEMTVANISRRFTILKDFDDAITQSLADIGQLSKASRAYLFLFRDDGKIMDNTHEWCSEGVSSEIHHLQNLPTARFPWLMKSFQHMNIIQIPDVGKMPEEACAEKEEFERENIKSMLLLAIRIERELAGFIGFDNVVSPDTWRVEDINLLSITAEIVGNAIARKRIEDSLRMSESEHRLLLENIPMRIFYKDKNSVYIACNQNFARDLCMKPEEIIGKIDYDLFPKELANQCRANDREVIESGKRMDVEERYFKDGQEFIIHTIKVPIKNENGTIIGILGSSIDITEKVHLEREAVRSRHLVLLGELAAGVAHEINNPITGVINCAQILLNKSREGSMEKDLAGRIIKEGDRVATIVSKLLSFARPEEKKNIASVHEILYDTLILMRKQLEEDCIQMKLDIPKDLPEVFANSQKIQQVFMNIISNAGYALNQKYPGGHENKILEILGEKTAINRHSYVKVTFCDHGTGIPAEIKDKIINPFFTTKPHGKGTGLGLNISYKIITDHHGKLTIDSVEGEYTRVCITLPAKDYHESAIISEHIV